MRKHPLLGMMALEYRQLVIDEGEDDKLQEKLPKRLPFRLHPHDLRPSSKNIPPAEKNLVYPSVGGINIVILEKFMAEHQVVSLVVREIGIGNAALGDNFTVPRSSVNRN